MSIAGQHGEVGQTPADVIFGHDFARSASMTERLPLRRLATSRVLPLSIKASATGLAHPL